MKRFLVFTLLTLVALTTLLPASTSHAGDVIDFLPEVQTARSFEIFWLALFSSDSGDFLDTCLVDQPSVDSIPDHLLVDINGALRTQEESVQLAREALCIVAGLFEQSERFSVDFAVTDLALELFLDLLRGEAVEFPSGDVLDGSKQIFRMAAAFQLFGFFSRGNPLVSALDPEGNTDPCEVLQQAAVSGETLELRYVALFHIAFEIGEAIDLESRGETGFINPICEYSDAPLSELKAAALAGDVNAATSYAGRLFGDILIFIGQEPDPEELERIESDLAALELEILSSTGRFPLWTLANTAPIFILELAIDFIEGAFD